MGNLLDLLTLFRGTFDQTKDVDVNVSHCEIIDDECTVSGSYNAVFKLKENENQRAGCWTVKFDFDKDLSYWYIISVDIEGLDL